MVDTKTENKILSDEIVMENLLGEDLFKVEITNIEWERVLVHFAFVIQEKVENRFTNRVLANPEIYLISGSWKANAKLDIKKIDQNYYVGTVNVTNPGYCMCLQEGFYSFYLCCDDNILTKSSIAENIAGSIESYNNFFMHGNGEVGFNVNFFLENTDLGLFPVMRIMDMRRSGYKSFNPLSKKKHPFIIRKMFKIKRFFILKARDVRHLGYKEIYSFFCWLYSLPFYKNDKKTILFMSEQNEETNPNLSAVEKRIIARGLDVDLRIYHSFRSSRVNKYNKMNWASLAYKMARAKVIFVDDHCPLFDWFKLSKNVKLIQLWHAGAGYKAVGYSRWGHKGSPKPFCCHRQYSYGITPSKNIAFFFSEQFGINEEQILPTGMPRMDEYLNESYRKNKTDELYEVFPQCRGKKVVLFAPTYRGIDKKEAYYPYEMIDFKMLYDYCGNDKVVLFKMHPWVINEVPIEKKYCDRLFDVSSYPNINDLFYITDLLITDYSSSIFEYSVLKKPALFYAFDELQYSYSRGFHRDYRSSTPGKICNTFNELIKAMKDGDYEFEKMEGYLQYHFDNIDSNACDRVIDWFLLDQMPEEYVRKQMVRSEELDKLHKMKIPSLRICDETTAELLGDEVKDVEVIVS